MTFGALEQAFQLWRRISVQKQLLLLGLISISALVTFTAWVLVDRTQTVINRSVEQFGMALAHALARGGAEALTRAISKSFRICSKLAGGKPISVKRSN